MIRSAKRNAVTPPKLMPPFHSTPASGTLPMEQTKLSRQMTGPMSGPQSLAAQRVAGQEQLAPETVGYPGADRPCDQQSADDVADDRGPFHDEDAADRGVAAGAGQPVPEAPAGSDAHVHRGVAFHGPGQALVRLSAGGVDDAADAGTAGTRTADSTIMTGPPTNSASVNCQPISRARMMPEFDNEVGARRSRRPSRR